MNKTTLVARGRTINLPAFFPDATRGVLKSLEAKHLTECGVEGVVVNTFHLMFTPGIEIVKSLGGIRNFMGWDGHIISDSGGFQMLSLIHKNSSFGKIMDDGIKLTVPSFSTVFFSPELCIRNQFIIGSDIVICLDDCPGINATREQIEISVERTISWAQRCKNEFNQQLKHHKLTSANRPLLFAVIQGGSYVDLRKKCADALLKVGFDGYGYGGWPMTRSKILDSEYLSIVSKLVPNEFPKYALGVGMPDEIAKCVELGYSIFDCVLPTRDARHKRLYVINEEQITKSSLLTKEFYSFINISKTFYAKDSTPICERCDCFTCKNYSKAYLHHLFKIKDTLAYRLASIHNLFTYSSVIKAIRDL